MPAVHQTHALVIGGDFDPWCAHCHMSIASPGVAQPCYGPEALPDVDCTGFFLGQRVIKSSGKYHPPGEYRGFITMSDGRVLVVIEHAYGMAHVYAPEQIEAVKP